MYGELVSEEAVANPTLAAEQRAICNVFRAQATARQKAITAGMPSIGECQNGQQWRAMLQGLPLLTFCHYYNDISGWRAILFAHHWFM